MQRLAHILVVCLTLVGVPGCFGAEDLPAAAKALFQALEGKDAGAVAASYAKLPNREETKVRMRAEELVEQWSKRPGKVQVLDVQKVDQELGVVAIQDRPGDLDPVFMIKQSGDWRILSLGDYSPAELKLEEAVMTRLDALKQWFKQEKRAIKAKEKQK